MFRLSCFALCLAAIGVNTACTPTGSVDDLDVSLEVYKVYRYSSGSLAGQVAESDACVSCALLPGEELEFMIRWRNRTGGWVTSDLPDCEDTDPADGGSILHFDGQPVDVFCENRTVESVEFAPTTGIYGNDLVSDTHVARLFVAKSDITSGEVALPFGESLTFEYEGQQTHFNLVDASF